MPLIDGLAGFRTFRTWAGSFVSEESYLKVSFVYNTAQVILSSALHYFPERAGSILKVQRTFIVLDAAFLIADARLLYKKLQKEPNDPHRGSHLGAIIVVLLTLSVTSAITLGINHSPRFNPAVDLNEILHQIAPREEIKDVTLQWEKPWIIAIAQWISTSRCFYNFLVGINSPPALKSYWTNAGLQLVYLLGISRLPFLKYQHISLQAHPSQATGKVTTSVYYFLPSLKDSYLHSAVQRIHQSCMRALQKLNPLSFLPPLGFSKRIYHYLGYISLSSGSCQPAPIWHHLFIEAEWKT